MRKFSRSARMFAAVAMPLAFVAAMPLADGMTYDFVMKSQSTRTGSKETVALRGRGTYASDQAKIEITDAGSSAGGPDIFGGKGAYFIMRGGGQEMLMVDPGKKQYMKWDMGNMLAGMSKMVNAVGGLVKMQMSDVHIDAQDLGPGGNVQGYPTRHIRMTQNYAMSVSVLGRSKKTQNQSTTDYYFAPSLRIANPFVSNSQQMAMMSQLDVFNNSDYVSQMKAANAKIPKTGVPLKTVTTVVATDEKGKAETTVTTMEMTNFRPGNIPTSAFAIPSDYQMVEMPNFNVAGKGNSGGGSGPVLNADSIAAAAKAGAAEGTKQEVKNGVKDATAKKLRGIFRH
jgi:hypothetical protein